MPYDLSTQIDVNDRDLLILAEEIDEAENSQGQILERLIERQAADLDPRPSSPNYVMSVPASFEFEADYENVERFKTNSFITTADREGLILRGLDFGMSPYPATYARLKGRFNIPLALGTAFSLDDLNYSVVEPAGSGDGYFYYILECDTPGVVGNTQLGRIIPTQYIPGLDITLAELTEVVVPGEEEEDTEAFRRRLLSRYQYKRFCGNRADYIAEACAIDGVGRVKVDAYEVEDGRVFIDLWLTDSEGNTPSRELLQTVQNYFNPLQFNKDRSEQTVEETGNGQAPINHFVQAVGVFEVKVDVDINVIFASEGAIETGKPKIVEKINEYFKECRMKWGDTEMTEAAKFPRRPVPAGLSKNRLGVKVLELEEVYDYIDITYSGDEDIQWFCVPVPGKITIGENYVTGG